MSCAFSHDIEHQSDESSARRVTALAKQTQTRRGCTSSSSAQSQYSIEVIDSMTLETIDDPMTRSFYSSLDSEGQQSEPEVPTGFQTLDDNCNEATMELVVFPKVNNKLILPDVGELSPPVNYQDTNNLSQQMQSIEPTSPSSSSQFSSSSPNPEFCFDNLNVITDVGSGDSSVYRINQGLYSIICKKVDLECNFCSTSFSDFSRLALHLQSHLDYGSN